jgi:hypothetical protein
LIVNEESSESDGDFDEVDEKDEPPPDPRSRAALPRALAMVDTLVASNVIKIKCGRDDNLAIYELAEAFELESSNDRLNFGVGWARRPLHGEIYGKSLMTDEYLALIKEMVQCGADDKSDKMNPKQMYDVLWKKYRLYSLPSENAIKGAVSAVLQSTAKGNAKSAPAKATGKLTKKEAAAELTLIEYMKRKILQRGWREMKPAAVIERALVRKKVCGRLTKKERTTLSSPAMRAKFSALKAAKKGKGSTIEKKALI